MTKGQTAALRIAAAKAAFTTRRVERDDLRTLLPTLSDGAPGDLVLARVDRLGQHKALQLSTGRRANLYVGDEIVACLGHRYAPDQFEAFGELEHGPCHLVAAGGLIGQVRHRHGAMSEPTGLTPLALLGDAGGRPVNVKAYALPSKPCIGSIPVIAVLGTSMNAGKTTAAADLIHGLANAGLKVGAGKVTGTGSGGDFWAMLDAGAVRVLDFTDAGFASTYKLDLPALEDILRRVVGNLAAAAPDVIVLEVADGIFQRETAMLLASPAFKSRVRGILFAAPDAVGATSGIERLRARGHQVIGVGGRIAQSPLACREAGEAAGIAVFGGHDLRDPEVARRLPFPEPLAIPA